MYVLHPLPPSVCIFFIPVLWQDYKTNTNWYVRFPSTSLPRRSTTSKSTRFTFISTSWRTTIIQSHPMQWKAGQLGSASPVHFLTDLFFFSFVVSGHQLTVSWLDLLMDNSLYSSLLLLRYEWMMLVVIMFSPDFCGVEKFLIYTLCCYFTLFSGMLLQGTQPLPFLSVFFVLPVQSLF